MARRCRLQEEFASAELGDARRLRRLKLLASRLGARPQASIPGACRGWAETLAAYRLLNCGEVRSGEILAAHRGATIQRANATRDLLMLQDTTEVDYSGHDALEGAGPLADRDRKGFFAHSRLVVSEQEGVVLGLEGSKIWARSESGVSRKSAAKTRPLEQKESVRWIEGYQRGCALLEQLPSNTRLTVVADRESDIYELFVAHAEAEGRGADFLVRACQDRALVDDGGRLFETCRQAPVLGQYSFEVRAAELIPKIKGNRKRVSRQQRKVTMTVRACEVTFRPPQRRAGQKLPPVTLWVICAREENPPKGQNPVEWILLTSWKVRSCRQAKRLLRIYSLRWLCEEFHYVLKSGCGIEDLALRSGDAICAALALYMVIAWRLLYLRDFSRAQPQLSSKDFFDPVEWQVVRVLVGASPKSRPPPLGEMIRMIGTLGGHLGRSYDAEPGSRILWRGLTNLAQGVLMWEKLEGAAGG